MKSFHQTMPILAHLHLQGLRDEECGEQGRRAKRLILESMRDPFRHRSEEFDEFLDMWFEVILNVRANVVRQREQNSIWNDFGKQPEIATVYPPGYTHRVDFDTFSELVRREYKQWSVRRRRSFVDTGEEALSVGVVSCQKKTSKNT